MSKNFGLEHTTKFFPIIHIVNLCLEDEPKNLPGKPSQEH